MSGREVCLGHRHPCGDQRTVCWSHVGSRDGARAVRLDATDLAISGHLRVLEHVCFQMSSQSPCSGPACLLSSDGRKEKQLRVLKTLQLWEELKLNQQRLLLFILGTENAYTGENPTGSSRSQTLSYSFSAGRDKQRPLPPPWWVTFVGLPPLGYSNHHYWWCFVMRLPPLAICYFLLSLFSFPC